MSCSRVRHTQIVRAQNGENGEQNEMKRWRQLQRHYFISHVSVRHMNKLYIYCAGHFSSCAAAASSSSSSSFLFYFHETQVEKV